MASAQHTITNAAQNPLCGRLQQKFSGRGVAAVSASETRTFPRVDAKLSAAKNTKYAKTVNPFEETAEFVPAGRAQTRTKTAANSTAAATRRTAARAQQATAAQQKTRTFATATPFASGAYAAAYARAAGSRAKAAAFEESGAAAAHRQVTPVKKRGLLAFLQGGRTDEVRVKSTPFPKGVILAAILFTAVVLMIIFSLAQIHQFKQEISALETRRAELLTEISQLSVGLDLKNDVRVIEQTAREDIGMVRSSQVESRYINIAQGDRVELVDAPEEKEPEWGVLDTFLSVFSGTWDNLMDHID